MMKKPVWDIFCQVIDNWGDAGVCWRLCKQLSQNDIVPRLWIDDPSPLVWMDAQALLPDSSPVQIVHWQEPLPEIYAGEALIEAFGCHAPEHFLQRIAAQPVQPVWINLEYLSAQPYAQECHGLASPQQIGPAKGLTRWFYYPGFTAQTGGLLREPQLANAPIHFDSQAWFKQIGIPVNDHTLLVSLFCYANQALPHLVNQWLESSTPVHVLVTPGASTQAMQSACQVLELPVKKPPFDRFAAPITTQCGNLAVTWLPYLTQSDFDHLLWSCDLNLVRGEDSWIRAIWAGKPFIWQPYIQEDFEHIHKLDAFIEHVPQATSAWMEFERQWCRQENTNWHDLLLSLPATQKSLEQLRMQLCKQPDLVSTLIKFVRQKINPVSFS